VKKRLLQAAVTGTDVPFPLLVAITESPRARGERGALSPIGAEFLYEVRLFPNLMQSETHASGS